MYPTLYWSFCAPKGRIVWFGTIPNPRPTMRVPPEEFEALVEQAFGNLPDEFKEAWTTSR